MVTKVKSYWSGGNLHFADNCGHDLFVFDAETNTVIIPSGSAINIKSGATLQNDGVDMDLSAGIATATTSTTGELNTLHSVTPGTVAASKAVVVDANNDASGFRNASGTGRVSFATATLSALPTVDPVSAGVLWNDSGTVKVSAGA
jgi:hypothetical protein